jgi:hypothetical protein
MKGIKESVVIFNTNNFNLKNLQRFKLTRIQNL